MFYQFTNVTYNPTGVAITDNTDFSLSGSSKKFVFPLSGDEVSIQFDVTDLTSYEEISMQIYTTPNTGKKREVFSIFVNAVEYKFDELKDGFNQILFDANYAALDEIKIVSNTSNLIMFFDLLGYRRVTFESMDKDIIKALANHISLDYGVETTLSKYARKGDKEIDITDKRYLFENSSLLIDGVETVELKTKDGALKSGLSSAYNSGDSVKVIVPTAYGSHKKIDSNPVCGILIYDRNTRIIPTDLKTSDKIGKRKWFLGNLFIMIYIECGSDNKLLELARQYEFNYGEQFNFLLDGEMVGIDMLGNGFYTPDILGNIPRMSYRYMIQPQPYTKKSRTAIDTINLTMESG